MSVVDFYVRVRQVPAAREVGARFSHRDGEEMMRIGDLAARAGTTTRTIRYYEELGIIGPARRTDGGFRLYSEEQVRRLEIVQGLKSLGFGLERIRALFAARRAAASGGELARALTAHLREQQEEIEAQIARRTGMRRRNEEAIRRLSGCLACEADVAGDGCSGCAVHDLYPDVPEAIGCAMYRAQPGGSPQRP